LVKGLVFKLDDVLSSEALLREGLFHQVVRKLRKRPNAPSEWKMLLRLLQCEEEGRPSKAWTVLYEEVLCGKKIISYYDLLRLAGRTVPLGTLFQGIPELAETLKRIGVRTAVMAGSDCPVQRNKVIALHLECLFDTIVYTDFFARDPLPAVSGALETLKARWKDLAPRQIAYIADDPAVDIPAARKAGLHTLRLRLRSSRCGSVEPRTPQERAEREFTSVPEMIEALCRYYRVDPGDVLPGEWEYYLHPRPWRFLK